MAAGALVVGEFRPGRVRVGFTDSRLQEFEFRVGFGQLPCEPSLDVLGVWIQGSFPPMFRIGVQIGSVVKVQGWVTRRDDIVIHISIWAADMAQSAGFGAHEFILGIDESIFLDGFSDAQGTLVMGVPPGF